MGLVFVFPPIFLLSLWCQGGSSSELTALFCALSSCYCYFFSSCDARAFRLVSLFFIDVDIHHTVIYYLPTLPPRREVEAYKLRG
jgi:hypothetical protein